MHRLLARHDDDTTPSLPPFSLSFNVAAFYLLSPFFSAEVELISQYIRHDTMSPPFTYTSPFPSSSYFLLLHSYFLQELLLTGRKHLPPLAHRQEYVALCRWKNVTIRRIVAHIVTTPC